MHSPGLHEQPHAVGMERQNRADFGCKWLLLVSGSTSSRCYRRYGRDGVWHNNPPAEPLVCGLLMRRHCVHELQAGALVMGAQQRTAVGVDLTHSLQCGKEFVTDCLLLKRKWTRFDARRAVFAGFSQVVTLEAAACRYNINNNIPIGSCR